MSWLIIQECKYGQVIVFNACSTKTVKKSLNGMDQTYESDL